MNYIFFFIILLIQSSNCFIKSPNFFNIQTKQISNNNNKIKFIDSSYKSGFLLKNQSINNKVRSNIPIVALNDYCPDYIQQIVNPIKINYGEKIVKLITNFLPTADGIAPHVLHANEFMINILLSNDYLPDNIKKILILNVIKISLLGDSIGSSMLHLYNDLVNCLLG